MEKRCYSLTQVIAIICIFSSLAFIAGWLISYGAGFEKCVEIGIKFVEARNVTIDVSAKEITQGLWQYKNNIGGYRDWLGNGTYT